MTLKSIFAVAATVLVAAVFAAGSDAAAQEAGGVRAEIAKPLQAAQEMLRGRRYREALTKIDEAERIEGKSADEAYFVARLKAAAALQAEDRKAGEQAAAVLMTSARMSAAEKQNLALALAGLYTRANDNRPAVAWYRRYFSEGGADPAARVFLAQALYSGQDYAAAVKELEGLSAHLAKNDLGGGVSAENAWLLLANSQLKLNNESGYRRALESLLGAAPKPEYWQEVLRRLVGAGFPERLRLDVYRLRLATGSLLSAADWVDMAELAIQAGYPGEADAVLKEADVRKMLKPGAQMQRQQRLLTLTAKKTAEDRKGAPAARAAAERLPDGEALVNTGLNEVLSGVRSGDKTDGLALMNAGLQKGVRQHPDEARLHLAYALFYAGQRERAREEFRRIKSDEGKDGADAATLARLWLIHLK